ncbi:MAG: hypothetical protein IT546_13075 [Caulobacteraceae bacterium]|nr:hypothetical protein [Caulobacteraceae bacterium]
MRDKSRHWFRFWMIPPTAVLVIAALVAASRARDETDAARRLDRVAARARALTHGEVLVTTAFKTEDGHLCGTFTTWDGPEGRDYGAFDEAAGKVHLELQSKGFSAAGGSCVARVHDLASLLERRDARRSHG